MSVLAVALIALAGASHATMCTAIDGDTLRCGSERIRLLGIDAPELRGHCRRGRVCAPGNPIASKRSLQAALDGRRSAPVGHGPKTRPMLNEPNIRPVEHGFKNALRVESVGRDRYGRTLAMVSAGGVDLSCHQLANGAARYRGDWDDGRRVARRCPSVARSYARKR